MDFDYKKNFLSKFYMILDFIVIVNYLNILKSFESKKKNSIAIFDMCYKISHKQNISKNVGKLATDLIKTCQQTDINYGRIQLMFCR